ncbi:MAG: hypothetical protein OEY94_10870 [Alphaproteobacteria bacterium]|nr:hypothetical protein [Alphaproteobacteria bacterium]
MVTLASQAADLFDRSTTEEKRKLIGYVFANLELEGQKLRFSLKKPFDLFVDLTSCQEWQGLIDVIGTNHYAELAELRPALQSVYDQLIAA